MSREGEQIIKWNEDVYADEMSSCLRKLIVKNLVVTLCVSIIFALITFCSIKFELQWVVEYGLYIFLLISLASAFLVDKEANNFNPKVDRLLFGVLALSGLVYWSVIELTLNCFEPKEHIVSPTRYDQTVTSSNLEALKICNSVQLKYLKLDDTKRGSAKVKIVEGDYSRECVYQVVQIKDLPHAYLGSTKNDNDIFEQPLNDIIVYAVYEASDYSRYKEAVRQCESEDRTIDPQNFTVFEILPDTHSRSGHPILIILGTLLVQCILLYLICTFSGLASGRAGKPVDFYNQ